MDPVAALDAAGDAGPRSAGGAYRRRTRTLPGRPRTDRADLRRGPPPPHRPARAADRTGRWAGPPRPPPAPPPAPRVGRRPPPADWPRWGPHTQPRPRTCHYARYGVRPS